MPIRDPEARREYARRWRELNRERIVEHNRRAQLMAKYGITPEEYDFLVMHQEGRCAICGTTDPGGQRNDNWHVDHDHETGQIRGLLCLRCNAGIGMLRDDVDIVRSAVEYLEKATGAHSEE